MRRSSRVEQHRLGFDFLDDEIDAVPLDHPFYVLGGDLGVLGMQFVHDRLRIDLDELEVLPREFGVIEIEGGNLIDREPETARCQIIEQPRRIPVAVDDGALGEFKNQVGGQHRVVGQELIVSPNSPLRRAPPPPKTKLRKKCRSAKAVRGNVAKNTTFWLSFCDLRTS